MRPFPKSQHLTSLAPRILTFVIRRRRHIKTDSFDRQHHFSLYSTRSNCSTICSAIDTSAGSAPAAALSSSAATCWPSRLLAGLFWQMPDQLAHIGERG
jgi:hypothetical protein